MKENNNSENGYKTDSYGSYIDYGNGSKDPDDSLEKFNYIIDGENSSSTETDGINSNDEDREFQDLTKYYLRDIPNESFEDGFNFKDGEKEKKGFEFDERIPYIDTDAILNDPKIVYGRKARYSKRTYFNLLNIFGVYGDDKKSENQLSLNKMNEIAVDMNSYTTGQGVMLDDEKFKPIAVSNWLEITDKINDENNVEDVNKRLADDYNKVSNGLPPIEDEYDKETKDLFVDSVKFANPDPNLGNILRAEIENPALAELGGLEAMNIKGYEIIPFPDSKEALSKNNGDGNVYEAFMALKKTYTDLIALEYRKQKLMDFPENNKKKEEELKNAYIALSEKFTKNFNVISNINIKNYSLYDRYFDNKIDTLIGNSAAEGKIKGTSGRRLWGVDGYLRGYKKGLESGWNLKDAAIPGILQKTISELTRESKNQAHKIDKLKKNNNISINLQENNNKLQEENEKLNGIKTVINELTELYDKATKRKVTDYDKKKVIDGLISISNIYLYPGRSDNLTPYERMFKECFGYVPHCMTLIKKLKKDLDKKVAPEIDKKSFKRYIRNREPEKFALMVRENGWPSDDETKTFLTALATLQKTIKNNQDIAALIHGKNKDAEIKKWVTSFNKALIQMEGRKIRGYSDYKKQKDDVIKMIVNAPDDIKNLGKSYDDLLEQANRYNEYEPSEEAKDRMTLLAGDKFKMFNNIMANLSDERNNIRRGRQNSPQFNDMLDAMRNLANMGSEDKIKTAQLPYYYMYKIKFERAASVYLNKVKLNIAFHDAGTRRKEAVVLAVYLLDPELGKEWLDNMNNARLKGDRTTIDKMKTTEGIGVTFPGIVAPQIQADNNITEVKIKSGSVKTTNVNRIKH